MKTRMIIFAGIAYYLTNAGSGHTPFAWVSDTNGLLIINRLRSFRSANHAILAARSDGRVIIDVTTEEMAA